MLKIDETKRHSSLQLLFKLLVITAILVTRCSCRRILSPQKLNTLSEMSSGLQAENLMTLKKNMVTYRDRECEPLSPDSTSLCSAVSLHTSLTLFTVLYHVTYTLPLDNTMPLHNSLILCTYYSTYSLSVHYHFLNT